MVKISKKGSLQGILHQIKIEHIKLRTICNDSKKISAWKEDDIFCMDLENAAPTNSEIVAEDDAVRKWWNEIGRINPPEDWNIFQYSDVVGLLPIVKE